MFLLDTDTVIYALKKNTAVLAAFARHESDPKALSVITYGELLYGALHSAQPTANAARVHHVAQLFPVIEVDRPIMDTFARLKAELHSGGKPLDDFDLVIAATALSLGYVVVTNNTRQFARVDGLKVVNWSRA